MIKIERHNTNIQNIFTYFDFVGLDKWEECDEIRSILINQIKCKELKSLEGIYSKHYVFEAKSFVFKLLYHEDFGNCLCSQTKEDDTYYLKLNEIADIVLLYLNDKSNEATQKS